MTSLTINFTDDQMNELAKAVSQRIDHTAVEAITEPLTVGELSIRLKVHEATIYRQVQAGNIKKVPHIAKVLIPASEANRLLGIQK